MGKFVIFFIKIEKNDGYKVKLLILLLFLQNLRF